MHENPRILISAGELSADEHASGVVAELRKLLPSAEFRAMGGRALRGAGVETPIDSEKSASVMGFSELFGSLSKILKALSDMKAIVRSWRPHLLIALDYPDFNFRLIKYAKLQGVRVLYFLPPQVWAWRSGRIEFLKRYTDQVASIFPFEERFMRERGLQNVNFVGHPFLADARWMPANGADRRSVKQALGLNPDVPAVAVFPGSRKKEIERNLAPMLGGLALLQAKHPAVQAVINVAPSIDPAWINSRLPAGVKVSVVRDRSADVLKACDAGLLKSGTSNLQAALCELPFAMFYIASGLSAWMVKQFVQLKEYSIVNVIRPGSVPELLQGNAAPEYVLRELEQLLFDEARRARMIAAFREIKSVLAGPRRLSGAAYAEVANLAAGLAVPAQPLRAC